MSHPAETVGAPRTARPDALARCRVCGSDDVTFLIALESTPAVVRDFFRCGACGSILDTVNVPPDYGAGKAARCDPVLAAKIAIEAEAGLFLMAALTHLIRAVIRGRARPVKYLEIGSEIGFMVHMAELSGWEAIGVEPSAAGQLGRELLGIDVRQGRVEDLSLPSDVDVIVASEVIEHLPDVDRFLDRVTKAIASDGVLVLTTPTADVLADVGRSEMHWRQSFAPGEHLTIFSPDSIRLTLERHGFVNIRLFQSEGSSGRQRLIVVAGRDRASLPDGLDWTRAR